VAAGWCLDLAVPRVDDLVRYNVGQYRHALDMTFGSIALAAVLSFAIAPPTARPSSRTGWIWIALIILDIFAGALFASRDAITVWRSFPWYETNFLPPLDRLTAYAPPWLNFTFNQYMIQFVHRMLSIGLWLGLVANVIWSVIWNSHRNPRAVMGAAALLVLMTAEMAAGITTLALGGAAAASFVHEAGAVFLLAGAFAVRTMRPSPSLERWLKTGAYSDPAMPACSTTLPQRTISRARGTSVNNNFNVS
jgi:heme A synthase